ncbi:hypothetical protein ACVQ9Z_08165 [Staphylococcus aureus]
MIQQKKWRHANPSDVNQGLEQAINDGKQSKVASQQQSKEVDNSQDSNANNNLPSQSLEIDIIIKKVN